MACGPGISDYSEKLWGNYEYLSVGTTKTSIIDTSSGNVIVDYCVETYWASATDKVIVAIRFPVNISNDSKGYPHFHSIEKSREIWLILNDKIQKFLYQSITSTKSYE